MARSDPSYESEVTHYISVISYNISDVASILNVPRGAVAGAVAEEYQSLRTKWTFESPYGPADGVLDLGSEVVAAVRTHQDLVEEYQDFYLQDDGGNFSPSEKAT